MDARKPHLVKLAQDLGIADKCHFPGYISDAKRLAAIYGMADLFCMAPEIETQGLVLLEATACGLPLVAVKATSMHEIVSDGVNGFLVPAGEVRSMAEAMTAILRDPGLSEKMGLASRQASFAHDFKLTVDAYEEIYLTTIQDRAAQKTANNALSKSSS